MEKVFRKSLRISKILGVMLCGLILIGNLSCSSDTSDSRNSSTTPKNGSISGKVTFSNVEENANSGIIVTLDKTDGLSTSAVTKSVASRSIVSGARSLVSSTVTENDGSYKFNNLEAGTYTIYAASSYSSEKAVFTNVVVRSAETTIAESLKLVATGSITGTITLDGTTTGNTGFLVFVAGTSFMAMTDDSGNYTISGVPAGKGYQVVATKGNVLHSLSSNVTVTANESTAMTENNFTTDEVKASIKGEQGEQGIQGEKGSDGKDGADGKDGQDGKNGVDGQAGISIVWLGAFASSTEIAKPAYLNAYFNTTDGCSYIYTGTEWTLLARSGANGADGKDGKDGKDGSSGTNESSGTNGTNGKDGKDGASIVWRGSFASSLEITNPVVLNAYYNTTDGCSYIYTTTGWNLLAKAGANGSDGSNGNDGTNGTDGTNGKDGASIVWRGSFASSSEVTNPVVLNAYYNTTDGCSYIYTTNGWTLLAKAGATGKDGTSGSGATIISSRLTSSIGSYAIATILSTEEITNEDVTITVHVTEDNLSKVGFVYSESQIDWSDSKSVLTNASFTAITADSEGKYKITARKNGYYTVVVKNSEGYVVATEDKISNIDKTAPAAVSGLTAKYATSTQKITVTWTKPTDSDLDYISLSYTKGGTAFVTDYHATSPYVLSDIEVDGSEYVFSVKAVDKTGNVSVVKTASVTPADGVRVQGITLSRYHFAYDDADQTVTAVVTLSNAELIEEGTAIKIQTKDPSGNVTNTPATLDKAAGTATATIIAPSTSSSNSGTTYTVLCKIGNEVADTTHTTRFNVSATTSLNDLKQSFNGSSFSTSKVQIPLSSVTSTTTEKVIITGHNLDLTSPAIQLYDSTGAAYFDEPIAVDTSEILWTAVSGENFQTIDTEIPVPITDDFYTVKVLFDGLTQTSHTSILQVYDVPKFTSFTIPLVSVTKEDNTVTAKIVGKNFDTPDVDLSNFNATCSAESIVASTSFMRKNDSVLNAIFTIPGTVGEYKVTVSYGSNSIEAIFKAQDFSTYHIGDVLLNDGTVVPYNAENLTFTDEQKAAAVCVLFGFNGYEAPLGLGLYNSAGGTNSGGYRWGKDGAKSYRTMFTDIICTPSVSYQSGSADIATFTGDTDGSENWDYICSVDPDGTANAAENYPAFDYVNNYAITFGLTGAYASGWYMPSIAELCYIYRSKDILNAVLDALGGVQVYSGSYWSSSQYGSKNYSSWFLTDGIIYSGDRENRLKVCCVLAFK